MRVKSETVSPTGKRAIHAREQKMDRPYDHKALRTLICLAPANTGVD